MDNASDPNEFWKENWIRIAIVVLLTILGIWSFSLISNQKKTPLESDLLTGLLTVASIGASWLVSKIYAEQSASRSLRDYGVQVARGVMVLQNQIDLLLNWVSEKRASIPSQPSAEIVDAHFDHIAETLQGYQGQTDATLRSIAGVIGDALKQYQDVMKDIAEAKEKARIESGNLRKEFLGNKSSGNSEARLGELVARLDNLSRDTEERISALAKKSSLPIFDTLARREIPVSCPACSTTTSTEIGIGSGQTKSLLCGNCSARFNVHSGSGTSIHTRLISTGVVPVKIDNPVIEYLQVADLSYTSNQLATMVDAMISLQSEYRSSGKGATLNEYIQRLISDPRMAKAEISTTRIRKFIACLNQARLFAANTMISFKAIVVAEFSPIDIRAAFCRAVAHRLGKAARPLGALGEKSAPTHLFGPSLRGDEADICSSAILSAFRNAR